MINIVIGNLHLVKRVLGMLLLSVVTAQYASGQGSWSSLTNLAPDYNGGVMMLMPDGSVLVKTYYGGFGGVPGTTWDKLTPDASGSYANGTWSTIATMANDRLYFSSWILNDGRMYIGGGEYGSGTAAEIYDPQANSWTSLTTPGANFSDGNSENLADGRLLLAVNTGTTLTNYFYNPTTNTYSSAPSCSGSHDEAAWLKLPDNSILQIDIFSFNSERYIPSSNSWVADGTVPVMVYDSFGFEAGAAFLLPDGRGYFIGSTPHTAFYTPSGSSSAGTWSAGPDIPGSYGAPDASATMMNNGKILMAVSPQPTSANHFPTPTAFYEFDYSSNTYTLVGAPGGGSSIAISTYITNMLQLPDGTVLFGFQGSRGYYVYTPGGSPLVAGKPTVDTIYRNNCDTFTVTGKLFTGISEGASYGDDWSMNTNYPLVRLTSGSNVYYARTYGWNRYGTVMTGSLADTTKFVLPAGLAPGTYTLQVVVNGNASSGKSLNTSLTISPSTAAVCPGNSTTLTDVASIGAWSSSNTGIASVGSTGVVTGAAAGTATITYAIGACYSTATVTVNPLPGVITGASVVCNGLSVTAGSSPAGGTWTSANSGIASIGSSSGLVTGNSAGTTTITYTLGTGCYITAPVTVNPLPAAIGGTLSTCPGASATLTDGTSGGTWTSGSTGVATIGSSTGTVTGSTPGTSVITYTLPTGCLITTTVTVNPLPGSISGAGTLCPSTTITLSDAGGGTWTSGSTGVATVGSASGVVAGVALGTATITYTLSTGCLITADVTVNASPSAISGPGTVCETANITLTDGGGGTWASGSPGIASIGSSTGVVTGNAAGTATINYTVGSGCSTSTVITVNPLPAAISGGTSACMGYTLALTDAGGGTWTSGSTGVATVGSSTGVVTPVSPGSSIITYALPTGCSITSTITVNSAPAGITGTGPLYLNYTLTFADVTAGGTWTSSNPSIATAGSSTGDITGAAAGAATVSYTLSTGCYATTTVSVAGTPAPITGAGTVCQTSNITLSDASAGGTWSSSNSSVASVASTGVVNGVGGGTATITYAIGGAYATKSVTVSAAAGAISGASTVCETASVTLSDGVAGGTWTSSNPSLASVGSSSGIVTGVAAGSPTISYTTACGSSATYPFTVNPLPSSGTITGGTGLCTGGTLSLSDAAGGGTWSISSGVATIGTSGVVSGVAISGGNVSYTVTNSFGCTSVSTLFIDVEGVRGNIYPFAGTGVNTTNGDGSAAYLAAVQSPRGMATDNLGNLYICDNMAHVVRKVSTNGIISRVAGNGTAANNGDGGAATSAALNAPMGVYVDASGNIYISSTNSHVVRKVNTSGIISTIAGISGSAGATGDGGPASAAKLYAPLGITGDAAGNLYICDQLNYKVRKINGSTGVITTIAGTGSNYFSGDGGPGTAARLSTPRSVAIDNANNLYIADGSSAVVRKLSLTSGIITSVAGTGGTSGSSGDGGQATAAKFCTPATLAFDGGKMLYITDLINGKVRQLDITTGILTRFAGTTSTGFSGDGAAATAAQIAGPYGIACDGLGNVYFADANNRRIRVVASRGSVAISGPASAPAGTSVTYTAYPSIKASSTTGVTYSWQKNGSTVATGSTSYTNSSPSNGDVYSFILTVAPVCGASYDDTSNAITLTVYGPPTPMETGEIGNAGGLVRLFPNPAHDAITVEGAGLADGPVRLTVLDQTGRVVASERSETTGHQVSAKIDTRQLPPAVYIVVVTDASGDAVRVKFIKD